MVGWMGVRADAAMSPGRCCDKERGGVMRKCFRVKGGWFFTNRELRPAPPRGHRQTYLSTKACRARGPAAAFYPADSTAECREGRGWLPVRVPHDWAADLPVDPEANMSQ